jgi:aspartate racemase
VKTIGLIGGLSWVSTQIYYSAINAFISVNTDRRMSGRLIVYSYSLDDIHLLERTVDWDLVSLSLQHKLALLKTAGADFAAIACNTAHIALVKSSFIPAIPIVNIVDTVIAEILKHDWRRVGILGTTHTVTAGLYAPALGSLNIDIVQLNDDSSADLHYEISNKLCFDVIDEQSLRVFKSAVEELRLKGAESIVLGCTELGLLLKTQNFDIPILDSASIHALAIARMSLAE